MQHCEYCDFFKTISLDKDVLVRKMQVCELTEFVFDDEMADYCTVYPCESAKYERQMQRKPPIRLDWKMTYLKKHINPLQAQEA